MFAFKEGDIPDTYRFANRVKYIGRVVACRLCNALIVHSCVAIDAHMQLHSVNGKHRAVTAAAAVVRLSPI